MSIYDMFGEEIFPGNVIAYPGGPIMSMGIVKSVEHSITILEKKKIIKPENCLKCICGDKYCSKNKMNILLFPAGEPYIPFDSPHKDPVTNLYPFPSFLTKSQIILEPGHGPTPSKVIRIKIYELKTKLATNSEDKLIVLKNVFIHVNHPRMSSLIEIMDLAKEQGYLNKDYKLGDKTVFLK